MSHLDFLCGTRQKRSFPKLPVGIRLRNWRTKVDRNNPEFKRPREMQLPASIARELQIDPHVALCDGGAILHIESQQILLES